MPWATTGKTPNSTNCAKPSIERKSLPPPRRQTAVLRLQPSCQILRLAKSSSDWRARMRRSSSVSSMSSSDGRIRVTRSSIVPSKSSRAPALGSKIGEYSEYGGRGSESGGEGSLVGKSMFTTVYKAIAMVTTAAPAATVGDHNCTDSHLLRLPLAWRGMMSLHSRWIDDKRFGIVTHDVHARKKLLKVHAGSTHGSAGKAVRWSPKR